MLKGIGFDVPLGTWFMLGLIVKSGSNQFLEPTSTQQWG